MKYLKLFEEYHQTLTIDHDAYISKGSDTTMGEQIDYIWRVLQKDCAPFLKESKGKWYPIYRIVDDYHSHGEMVLKNVRKDRKPRDTQIKAHKSLDDAYFEKWGIRPRSQGSFATAHPFIDIDGEPHLYFPIGEYKYVFHKGYDDLIKAIEPPVFYSEERILSGELDDDLEFQSKVANKILKFDKRLNDGTSLTGNLTTAELWWLAKNVTPATLTYVDGKEVVVKTPEDIIEKNVIGTDKMWDYNHSHDDYSKIFDYDKLMKWVDVALENNSKRIVEGSQMDGLFDIPVTKPSGYSNYAWPTPNVKPELMFLCDQYYLIRLFKIRTEDGKIFDIRKILSEKINDKSYNWS